jgi:hypothetical protein
MSRCLVCAPLGLMALALAGGAIYPADLDRINDPSEH